MNAEEKKNWSIGQKIMGTLMFNLEKDKMLTSTQIVRVEYDGYLIRVIFNNMREEKLSKMSPYIERALHKVFGDDVSVQIKRSTESTKAFECTVD